MKLDDYTYQTLFNHALQEWKKRTKTNEVVPSDVAYTILEMEVMLIDMLHYYTQQLQSSHLHKYDKLQGKRTSPRIAIPIPFYLDLKKDMFIRKGMQFPIHQKNEILMMETRRNYELQKNRICSIYYQSETHTEDISALLQALQGTYWLPDDTSCSIYIQLEKPVPIATVSSFYICLDQDDGDRFYSIAEGSWEYHTIHGWQCIHQLIDDTNHLRCSGAVHLHIDKPMKKITYFKQHGYWFRYRLSNHIFDHLIGIRAIWNQVIELYAGNTLAKTWQLDSLMETTFQIEDDIAKESLYLHVQDDDANWYAYPFQTWQQGHFTMLSWKPFANHIKKARITAQRSELEEKCADRKLTGMPSQHIAIASHSEYTLSFAMEQGIWQDAHIQDVFTKGTGDVGCYRDEHGIHLGDGRDFQLPPKTEQGIFITSFHQKQPSSFLQSDTMHFFQLDISGKNAISSYLYKKKTEHPGICYYEHEMIAFLKKETTFSLSFIRVKAYPNLWHIYIMDPLNRACHLQSYRSHIAYIVKKHLPFFDDVVVHDMEIKEVTVMIIIHTQTSNREDFIKQLIQEHLQYYAKLNKDIYGSDILNKLREHKELEHCERCLFYLGGTTDRLSFQIHVLYTLKDIQYRYMN